MALNFPFKKPVSGLSNFKDEEETSSEFLKAISLFTSQRNKLGISLEELSTKTKISRNVLIAIEKGWKKYLPETTYLISMLKMIEVELDLEKGSLNGLLRPKITNNSLSNFKLDFINIDFLSTWTGSLIYLIVMLLSIFSLNIQQKYLLRINSLSTEPVNIKENNIEKRNSINNN